MSEALKNVVFDKRHPDEDAYDRIELEVVERWKESELSGDEWRFSWRVRLFHKGQVIRSTSFHRLNDALLHLGAFASEMRTNEEAQAWQAASDHKCMQPGCAEEAVVEYQLKQEFSDRGEGPLPDPSFPLRRRFCLRHRERGDCSREDCMTNYDVVADPHV